MIHIINFENLQTLVEPYKLWNTSCCKSLKVRKQKLANESKVKKIVAKTTFHMCHKKMKGIVKHLETITCKSSLCKSTISNFLGWP
jgi:hypothetical protein